jgi:glycosyltransferase involved in cell wall biosynthesis
MADPDLSLPDSLQQGDGPLVSVVVPTYGDAEYLPKALESIAAQTHDNTEVVVVDSTGVGWLERLAEEIEGFKYIYQEPRGLAAARNRGIEVATGEVIAFLDADDYWHPEKLEKQLDALSAGADVVYSDAYIVENGTPRRQSSLPVRNPATHHIDFLLEGGVPVPTVLARYECFETIRFNEDLPAVEDRNLLARLFERYRPVRVPEPLAYYRRREASMSSDAEVMYESELASLADLFERFDDLDNHREDLLFRAKYAYGKRLLRTGRSANARRVLCEVVTENPHHRRALALVAVSFLPFGHRRVLRGLEAIQERVRE